MTSASVQQAPAPCHVFVGANPITEVSIAQEMQYHPAANPHESRGAAARALVVRELLLLEAERLGIDGYGVQTDGETHE